MQSLAQQSTGVEELDCLVIGGGPAGLTAAIYLARYHLSVAVVDAGQSRAAQIPLSRNLAGFPEGIPGPDLLARMCRQVSQYGARMHNGLVFRLEQSIGGFRATGENLNLSARSVLLATGVTNKRPPMIDERAHATALAEGVLRYCPVCDGYEVTDRRVAVFGSGDKAIGEAIFLRSYTRDLTLVADDPRFDWSQEQRRKLFDAGITLITQFARLEISDGAIAARTADGILLFDSLYPALGSIVNSHLARDLGANFSKEGCLIVDAHQRTSIPGLYAAGDVVLGLDQISHAMGEGSVGATTIRNDLAKSRQQLR